MKFGRFPLNEALGAILAHAIPFPGGGYRKGHVLNEQDLRDLMDAGIGDVLAVRLEDGDVPENTAAARCAASLAGPGVTIGAATTGRVNIHAAEAGLLRLDTETLHGLNRIDEALTVATLPPFTAVATGQMVATVKIIPFAASETAVAAWEQHAKAAAGPISAIAPFAPRTAGLIQTKLPGSKTSVLDKTARLTQRRLETLGAQWMGEHRCDHTETDLLPVLQRLQADQCRLLCIAGATAISDRRDIIPAAITAAGGTILHYGMPVDPGNLLLLAQLGAMDIVGLPGCARSPKLNGLDWVLQRLMADIPIARADITAMGVGGLLLDTPLRPQPRETASTPRAQAKPHVTALVLAAGLSRRMGAVNKLLAPLDGRPILAHCLSAVASRASEGDIQDIIVVTGHDAEAVTPLAEAVLAEVPHRFVHNPEFEAGLASSLVTGLAALSEETDGVLVTLGDMPRLQAETIEALIGSFDPQAGRAIILPTVGGKRGNPVLFASRFVPEMMAIEGDVGAKHLIGTHADWVYEVEIPDDGPVIDIDTPEALLAAQTAKKA